MPCINEQIEAAGERERKLGMLCLLRPFPRNPLSANGLSSLEGMAQESCVLVSSRFEVVNTTATR
jgi:hypothetical protein